MIQKRSQCGLESCRKESYFNSNIKYSCGECKSCKDQKKSYAVLLGHIPGKFCKESNVCALCCKIKQMVRFFRHFGGTCNNSRRCEWCNGYGSFEIDQEKKYVIKLYKLMLQQNSLGEFGYLRKV